MSASGPLVSICIPCYNAERYLGDTLRSVLAQTYANLEIIVCDDCSTDRSLDIARAFSDPRLSIRLNPKNLGSTGNYNHTLSQARGKYAKLLPADDTLAPDCVEKQVAAFAADAAGDVVVVSAHKNVMDESGRRRFGVRVPFRGVVDGVRAIKKAVRRGRNIFGETGALLLKTAVVRQLEPLRVKYCDDLELCCKMLMHGKLSVVDEPLFNFRLVGTSETAKAGWRQARFVRDFFAELQRDPRSGVTQTTLWLGYISSATMSVARNLVCAWVSRGDRKPLCLPPPPPPPQQTTR